jgi:hypothetical protein
MPNWDELAYRKDQDAFSAAIRHIIDRINAKGCVWGQKEIELIELTLGNFIKSQNSKVEKSQNMSQIALEAAQKFKDQVVEFRTDNIKQINQVEEDINKLKPIIMDALECAHRAVVVKEEMKSDNATFLDGIRKEISEAKLKWWHYAIQLSVPVIFITIIIFMFQTYVNVVEKRIDETRNALTYMMQGKINQIKIGGK